MKLVSFSELQLWIVGKYLVCYFIFLKDENTLSSRCQFVFADVIRSLSRRATCGATFYALGLLARVVQAAAQRGWKLGKLAPGINFKVKTAAWKQQSLFKYAVYHEIWSCVFFKIVRSSHWAATFGCKRTLNCSKRFPAGSYFEGGTRVCVSSGNQSCIKDKVHFNRSTYSDKRLLSALERKAPLFGQRQLRMKPPNKEELPGWNLLCGPTEQRLLSCLTTIKARFLPSCEPVSVRHDISKHMPTAATAQRRVTLF